MVPRPRRRCQPQGAATGFIEIACYPLTNLSANRHDVGKLSKERNDTPFLCKELPIDPRGGGSRFPRPGHDPRPSAFPQRRGRVRPAAADDGRPHRPQRVGKDDRAPGHDFHHEFHGAVVRIPARRGNPGLLRRIHVPGKPPPADAGRNGVRRRMAALRFRRAAPCSATRSKCFATTTTTSRPPASATRPSTPFREAGPAGFSRGAAMNPSTSPGAWGFDRGTTASLPFLRRHRSSRPSENWASRRSRRWRETSNP